MKAKVKRLFDDGTHWRLQSDNPQHPPRLIKKTDRRFQVAAIEKKWGDVE